MLLQQHFNSQKNQFILPLETHEKPSKSMFLSWKALILVLFWGKIADLVGDPILVRWMKVSKLFYIHVLIAECFWKWIQGESRYTNVRRAQISLGWWSMSMLEKMQNFTLLMVKEDFHKNTRDNYEKCDNAKMYSTYHLLLMLW